MPRSPALHATAADLDQAEAKLDVQSLVNRGLETATQERYRFAAGQVERVESLRSTTA
jgi:hypothetical protein